jgi:hypothetical protein
MTTDSLFILRYAHGDSAPMSMEDLIDQVKYANLNLATLVRRIDAEEWMSLDTLIASQSASSTPLQNGATIFVGEESQPDKLISNLWNDHTSQFQHNKEWLEYIRLMWPWEFHSSHFKLLETNHHLWYDVNFQIASLRYFMLHGGENQLIDDTCRQFCMGAAERLVPLLKALGWGEAEQAYEKNLRYIETYHRGVSDKVFGETEITRLMKSRVNS